MTAEQFQSLLKRYREGLCTPEEQRFVEAWYASIESKEEESLTHAEELALQNRYWQNVNAHIQAQKPARKIFIPAAIGIAASLVFAIITFTYLQSDPDSAINTNQLASTNEVSLESVSNDGPEPKNIALPDGSAITLQPGGKISYLASFNKNEREIYLEGEAFFEVKRDETRPFMVYAAEVTTKVLGTSFTVKARPGDKDVTVSVKTGKVSVYRHQGETKSIAALNETILTPNQKVVYNRQLDKVSRMLVEDPQTIIPAEEIKKLHFEDAAVSEIFAALERVYGVDIVFDAKALASCTLTTSIAGGTIYNRLDIICKATSTTYSVEETQIVIQGTGCN